MREATLRALHGTGAAAVFVTHDQAEALAVGDRVAVMRSGRFEHVAAPAEAFHAPATRFSARLLGEADFLDGVQTGDLVETEAGRLQATPGASGRVEVMLRPHEVSFVVATAGAARIAAREFRGASYVYTLRLPSGAQVRSVQPHTVDAPVGAAVELVLDPGHPVRTFGLCR